MKTPFYLQPRYVFEREMFLLTSNTTLLTCVSFVLLIYSANLHFQLVYLSNLYLRQFLIYLSLNMQLYCFLFPLFLFSHLPVGYWNTFRISSYLLLVCSSISLYKKLLLWVFHYAYDLLQSISINIWPLWVKYGNLTSI